MASPSPLTPGSDPSSTGGAAASTDGRAAARRPSHRSRLLREWGPWVVAILALAWVMRTVHWGEFLAVVKQAPVAKVVVFSVVVLIVNCAADSLAMYYTFGWFGCRVPARDLYVIRAATYLLAVVQYYVGQAALIGWLSQTRGVPLLRASGWILFISGINMGVLLLLSGIGLLGYGAGLPWVPPVVAGIAVLIAGYAAVLWWRPRAIAGITLLAPLFEMGIVGHVKATIVRLPHVLLLIVWHAVLLRWFGVDLPWTDALALLPVVFFAAALPISVNGLGPSQAAAVFFFEKYAVTGGREAVLAYSLSMTTVSLATQIVMGIIFLPLARRMGLHKPTDRELEAAEAAPGEEVGAEA